MVQVTWQDVAVGDMVYVAKDHSMPADLLLISSSDQEYGKCYVDTANLDGETNLKSRQALTKCAPRHPTPAGQRRPSLVSLPWHRTKHITEVADVTKLRARVHCEAPSPDIYNFSGNIALGDDESLPLSADSILLRGCVLRNTECVHCAPLRRLRRPCRHSASLPHPCPGSRGASSCTRATRPR